MTAIVILNAVFAVLVFVSILSLLGGAIVAGRASSGPLIGGASPATEGGNRARRRVRRRLVRVLDLSR